MAELVKVEAMVEVKEEVEVTVAVGGKVQQPILESNVESLCCHRAEHSSCVPST